MSKKLLNNSYSRLILASCVLTFAIACDAEQDPSVASDDQSEAAEAGLDQEETTASDIPMPSQDLEDSSDTDGDDSDANDITDGTDDSNDTNTDDTDVDDTDTDDTNTDDSSDGEQTITDENDTEEIVEDTVPPPTNYGFSDSDSLVYVQVYRDESALGGHDHVIRATNWTGSLTHEDDDPTSCILEFSIPVGDLAVDETAMRDLVGYGDSLSENDRNEIRSNMISQGQLNAAANPYMYFSSTSCSKPTTATGSISVVGNLNIRGQDKVIQKDFTFTEQDEKLFVSGTLDITHDDFGFTPYSALFGVFKNANEMTITLDMMGIPAN